MSAKCQKRRIPSVIWVDRRAAARSAWASLLLSTEEPWVLLARVVNSEWAQIMLLCNTLLAHSNAD